MKEVRLVPHGWPCTLNECPPGPFVGPSGELGFKTEYGAMSSADENGRVGWTMTNRPDAYCLDTGEFYWGGTTTHDARGVIVVQPLTIEITEVWL